MHLAGKGLRTEILLSYTTSIEFASNFSGKGSLLLALEGQNCWMCRFFFFAFPWTAAFQSWNCYFCVHMESTGPAAEVHTGLQTGEDFVSILNKRWGTLAHVLWAFSSVISVIITLLRNIWCNSIKINDTLFDEKSSSVTVRNIACSRLSLWEKEKVFWNRTSLQYPIPYIGTLDVRNLSEAVNYTNNSLMLKKMHIWLKFLSC